MRKLHGGKGTVGTSTPILPLRPKEKRQARQRIRSQKIGQWKMIHDVHNWHVDALGKLYCAQHRTGKMITGVQCPDHILVELRRQGRIP